VLVLLIFAGQAGAEAVAPNKARSKAQEFEKRGAWLEACRAYDDVLRRDRTNISARQGYQRCLRRLQVQARHLDPLYRQTITRLNQPQALDTYEQVLSVLTFGFPDRPRTSYNALFQHGLDELRLALDEPNFQKQYLAGLKPATLDLIRQRLAEWVTPKLTVRYEARKQLNLILAMLQKEGVSNKPQVSAAIALEFTAGACNALDEYSSFLTPGHLAAMQALDRGKVVGVGLELGVIEGTLRITEVYPKGPALEAGLLEGDRVLGIDGVEVHTLPADAVASKMRGQPNSTVEIEVERDFPMGPEKRLVKLTRRAVPISSVVFSRRTLEDGQGVGYLRIRFFHDSTLQEVKDALKEMTTNADPIKGLVLDLRGNPGGLFKSAVAVAELFLNESVVVVGESVLKEFNRPFKVETPGAFQLPMVVLIDAETASAAEVLAGALKEGRSTRPIKLLGQTSLGKGSIQCIIPMTKGPLENLAAIRLTVANLFSPANQAISKQGVTPHDTLELCWAEVLEEAFKQLTILITPAPRMVVEARGM
jgi:carboxyl-terminal processing protease